MMTFEKIAVKKLTICLGVDPHGQMVLQAMSSTETVKIFVIPGKLAIIEVTNAQGKTVKETPLGPFGWEYIIEPQNV